MSFKETTERRVSAFIKLKRLFSGVKTVLAAVSGGADSVCMLYLLYHLRDELGIELHVAHLDHGLRDRESQAEARYVKQLARRLGLPCTADRRNVLAYRESSRTSLEEAARIVRYQFLADAAKSAGAQAVAAGHTRDDNLETILMHLLRGSGTGGMRGLSPLTVLHTGKGDISVARPLLEISREETSRYCRTLHLKPRVDPSNESLVPMRNRVRHELMPLLGKYNPRFDDALLRSASAASEDMDFLRRAVSGLWGTVVEKQGETLVIDRMLFLALHPALQRHLLRSCMERLLGGIMDIEWRHIADMLALAGKPAGRSVNLPGGLVFTAEHGRLLLGGNAAELCPYPPLEGEYRLNIPGTTEVPGWRIEAEITERGKTDNEDFTACMDVERTGMELYLGPPRRGDRFQPMGMAQEKKLGRFLIDARVPRAWRSRIPVVRSAGRVVWLAGLRLDERVKICEGTRETLCLTMRKTGGGCGGQGGGTS